MQKRYVPIILSYGLFLGWLLSFPYNGPLLEQLLAPYDLAIASYSLTYTAVPVLFLIGYSFFSIEEKYSKSLMTWSLIVSMIGTLILFLIPPTYWYPVLALMGIASVLYIISWSYFYTMEIPIQQKLQVMALVIFTGNIIYYILNILTWLPTSSILILLELILGASLLASSRTTITQPIEIPLKNRPFPTKLIFITCLFLFLININDGLSFHAIAPSFNTLFPEYSIYYGILPYLTVLLLLFFLGQKIPLMFHVFIGTSLLGLAYLSFGLLTENLYSYFLTDTLLQAGWAMMDLVLWTLFGLIASIYGRPLKITGYAFLANLFGVFAGGLIGVQILAKMDNAYLISAVFSVSIIFISLMLMHLLNQVVEKDLGSKISSLSETPLEKNPLALQLPQTELLSKRETEVAELLIQGYTNKQIADMLNISENTVKTHTKKIYSKLNVSNKRELLQLSLLVNK